MLYLLPNLLGPSENPQDQFAPSIAAAVLRLDGLIAENEKAGRAFLKLFKIKMPLQQMPVKVLDEHTLREGIEELLSPLMKGETWGLVSDAGLPCLADPGSNLVSTAYLKKINVVALPGPSSIFLSLMLSGLSGQRFYFRGYLPKEGPKRDEAIRLWEREAKKEGSTQIFIETPYKNQYAFEALLALLEPRTLLCVARDLTLPTEYVKTATVENWRKMEHPELAKHPTIFLFNQ